MIRSKSNPARLLAHALSLAPALALMVGSATQAEAKQARPMSEVEVAAIKIACEDLSEQYAHYLDGKDYTNLAKLFTEDGVWEVLGNRAVGPAAVAAYWKSRTDVWAPGHGRVHQMANQVVRVVDRDHAVGQSTVIIMMFNTQTTEKQSLAPTVISRNDDEYVRTNEGWKFKRRTITTVAQAEPRH